MPNSFNAWNFQALEAEVLGRRLGVDSYKAADLEGNTIEENDKKSEYSSRSSSIQPATSTES